MPEALTTKNLFLKWKELNIIECDDFEESKFKWQRIAVAEYKNKLYYIVINSGIVDKVVPLEDMPYEYYNSKVYNENIDRQIDNIIDKLKNLSNGEREIPQYVTVVKQDEAEQTDEAEN